MFCVEEINKEHFKNTVWISFLSETSEIFSKYSLPWIPNHAIEYLSSNRKNMLLLCYGLLFSTVVVLLTKLTPTVCTLITKKQVNQVARKMFTLTLYKSGKEWDCVEKSNSKISLTAPQFEDMLLVFPHSSKSQAKKWNNYASVSRIF